MITSTEVFRHLNEEKLEVLKGLTTPCYVLEEAALRENARILQDVARAGDARLLLAQKAFSNFNCYPLFQDALTGTEASGLFEARLGYETLPEKEVHVFAAAYLPDEWEELLTVADHILFNSITQLKLYGPSAKAHGKKIGLRINPEYSTQVTTPLYDPCAPGSRLGVTKDVWDAQMTPELLQLIDGLHIHTLCEQDAEDLVVTWQAFEAAFGDVLPRMSFVNLGGGHHITKQSYDREKLVGLLRSIHDAYEIAIYLEPGEAWALNAGYLATRILDIVQNNSLQIAILDASAACHAPDVLEMPYQPPLYEAEIASEDTENGTVLRLASRTCLAGDVFGDYCFQKEKQIGDLLLFGDMAIYTTCKNNTFNGMALPSILLLKEDRTVETLATFSYQDFRSRLGR